MFNSLRRIQKKFNSVSRIQKKFNDVSQFKNKAQLFESHWKKFKSLSHVQKSSILWVCSKKNPIHWDIWKKGFNSMSHIVNWVQFCELYSLSYISSKKNGSILWVMFKFYESKSKKGFNSVSYIAIKKNVSILWDMFKKWVQFLWIMLNRRVQYCESCWKEWRIQFFESCWTEGFNSLSHFEKRVSILWVKLKRWVQFLESYFQSVQCSQFFFLKKILWITFKKSSILCVILKKKQFFESNSKNNIFESN